MVVLHASTETEVLKAVGDTEKETGMNTSQVAHLKEQIELECQSIQHLTQSSALATHSIINRKYQNLDHCHQQLRALVSEEEALRIVVEAHGQWME
jgi:hypothetical protein